MKSNWARRGGDREVEDVYELRFLDLSSGFFKDGISSSI